MRFPQAPQSRGSSKSGRALHHGDDGHRGRDDRGRDDRGRGAGAQDLGRGAHDCEETPSLRLVIFAIGARLFTNNEGECMLILCIAFMITTESIPKFEVIYRGCMKC
jgi:hypothetical protein